MKTLYQRSDEELERLRDKLTWPEEPNITPGAAMAAEATAIVEAELRWETEPVARNCGSGAGVVATAQDMVTEELARRVDDRQRAAVLQRMIEAEDKKPVRKRAPIVNPSHAWTWLGDAKVWMEVAVGLDQHSRKPNAGIHDHNESNVAHVATGFAFELVYKCLVVGEFEPLLQKHSCQFLHDRLTPETQARLETIMVANGWSDSNACVKYLDERMSNADRKYWMVNPDRARRRGFSVGTSFIVADSPMAIARLGLVLFGILPLATTKLRQAQRAWDYLVRMQSSVPLQE